jgi:hypothetical protein
MRMTTVEAIYRAYEADQKDDFRDHLGASAIGHECDRHVWYVHRWAARQRHPGRILRLFDTGNLAEVRFVADLRRIGVQVLETDPDTGRQWQVRDSTGHYGGSIDALVLGLPEAPDTWMICEMKTHNAKSFKDLVAKGVRDSKPLHWQQMQAYLALSGYQAAFYLAVNKDTDELYQEIVPANQEVGARIMARAQSIISDPEPPPRISNNATFFLCKMCKFTSVCHGTDLPERHCRSCLSSTPVEDGQWHCVRHGNRLNSESQRRGCSDHKFIPQFVIDKGMEQTDAADDAAWIEYQSPNGEIWRDTGL